MGLKTLLSFCLIAFSSGLFAQATQDVRILQLTTINGLPVNMRNFIGQKIIIVTIDASNVNMPYLKSLDSLSRNSVGNIAIIGVPVNDFGAAISDSSLVAIIDSLHISIPVMPIGKGKRGNGQNSLMSWITSTSPNNPFNIDLQQPGEVFVISGKGVLYGVLPAYSPLGGTSVSKAIAGEPAQ
jgi:glutathione peroxidase-family protein